MSLHDHLASRSLTTERPPTRARQLHSHEASRLARRGVVRRVRDQGSAHLRAHLIEALAHEEKVKTLPSEIPNDDDEKAELYDTMMDLGVVELALRLDFNPENLRPKVLHYLAIKELSYLRCWAERSGDDVLVRYYEVALVGMEVCRRVELESIEKIRRKVELKELGYELPRALERDGDDFFEKE
ncbi:hypothetical protein QBC41DRAFT_333826 [Cercophora samala]|uniref:Uncharacterized protein n=1 Tax=Cercophora samala TaxID=330535 RepID=A0AA40DFJ1_9PEZI|nr:hypothetical protein QBC41DRAFT_333826 [Cercophora samala]